MIHRKIGIASFALLAVTASSIAFANDESGKTVQSVGSQNSGLYYVVFNEPMQLTCKFNTIYLPDPDSSYGKSMLAILLAAHANHWTVRVSYTQSADGFCTASLISA